MTSLRDWLLLKKLSPDFFATIRIAYVFGNLGNEALLIVNDDKVYGVGNNHSGCLGVGDKDTHPLPKEITSLSHKNIEGLVCGGDLVQNIFVVAYSRTGEIYYWGSVSPGTSSYPFTKPKKLDTDLDLKVTALACGQSHCMILCDDGKVFTWGYNDHGQLGHLEIPTTSMNRYNGIRGSYKLCQVRGILEGKRVISISCGKTFSVALLHDGMVVTWGNNQHGQLGINKISPHSVCPVEVSALKDVEIKKIVCGASHVLALSKENILYGWGSNNYSQLGFSNPSNSTDSTVAANPTQMSSQSGFRDPLNSTVVANAAQVISPSRIYNPSVTVSTAAANSTPGVWQYIHNPSVSTVNMNPLRVQLRNPSISTVAANPTPGMMQFVHNPPICTVAAVPTQVILRSGVSQPSIFTIPANPTQVISQSGVPQPSISTIAANPTQVSSQSGVPQPSSSTIAANPTQVSSQSGVPQPSSSTMAANLIPGSSQSRSAEPSVPTTAIYSTPVDLSKYLHHQRVIDIGASHAGDFSVVQCESGEVFVFGKLVKGILSEPTKFLCESIEEVCSFHVSPRMMLKPMRHILEAKRRNSIRDILESEFGNEDTSDLTVVVENKEIHVHQTMLKMRSMYLKLRILAQVEKDEKVLTIEDKSFAAINAYLKYLYTDKLDVDLNLAIELLQLAIEYGDDGFRSICERSIKRDMKTDMVADVFILTRKHKECEDLNKFCLDFIQNNSIDVLNSPGFDKWDADTMKAVLRKYMEK